MTTATRTPPQHGERRCYLRGCRQPECTAANARYCKQYSLSRHQTGRRRIPSTDVLDTVTELHTVWSLNQIADASNCNARVIFNLVHGENRNINKAIAAAILAAPDRLTGVPGQVLVDATGTIRRGRALVAIGHRRDTLADATGIHVDSVSRLLFHADRVTHHLAERMSATYRKLASRPGTSTRGRNKAARLGWAPPAAWDDDLIDNPQAQPEWTGHCGSDRGWWTHRLERIPVCPPCQTAHDAWKTERKHLPRNAYMTALARAKGAASNRGASIAHDARELMRISGLNYEATAERLGITKQHLQQELGRHPERLDTAA